MVSSNSGSNGTGTAAGLYLSTGALEQRLRKLKDESAAQSQLLTQKLAESQSGQNLLHMSTRLSTLPPLLHSLLQQLHPVLSSAERAEEGTLDQLQRIRQQVVSVRVEQRRASHAVECSNLYQDVLSAERILRQRQRQQQQPHRFTATKKTKKPKPLHGSSGTRGGWVLTEPLLLLLVGLFVVSCTALTHSSALPLVVLKMALLLMCVQTRTTAPIAIAIATATATMAPTTRRRRTRAANWSAWRICAIT